MMSKATTLFCVILFTGSVVMRDVALSFFLDPLTTLVSAEIQHEKESTEKEGKEGHKEKDEHKIQCSLLILSELTGLSFHSLTDNPNLYNSIPGDVAVRPPEQA